MALTPVRMTTNLQIHLRAAGTGDMKRYIRALFWLGGAASHKMDRTDVGIFMGCVG